MARTAIPLVIDDVSAFARRLRNALAAEPELPGHLALLNHIARAAGHANFQDLRAGPPAPPAAPSAPKAKSQTLARALQVFDAQGRMRHWPNRTSVQGLCLWAFWARMPPRKGLTEAEVNEMLKAGNLFGDHVLLRRSLIDHRLVTRAQDGSLYTRIEQSPPDDALLLIRAVG